jgi:hypothetical protein
MNSGPYAPILTKDLGDNPHFIELFPLNRKDVFVLVHIEPEQLSSILSFLSSRIPRRARPRFMNHISVAFTPTGSTRQWSLLRFESIFRPKFPLDQAISNFNMAVLCKDICMKSNNGYIQNSACPFPWA